jgi:hypothetical protein
MTDWPEGVAQSPDKLRISGIKMVRADLLMGAEAVPAVLALFATHPAL